MGINAYQDTQTHLESARAREYRTLAQLTAGLMDAQRQPAAAALWAQAVYRNQQFWSHLRMDAVNGSNGLPPALSQQLIALAEWVERESIALAGGEGDMESLIAVNRQIMDGLKPLADSAPAAVDAAGPEALAPL